MLAVLIGIVYLVGQIQVLPVCRGLLTEQVFSTTAEDGPFSFPFLNFSVLKPSGGAE